jgi:hypothetical protein
LFFREFQPRENSSFGHNPLRFINAHTRREKADSHERPIVALTPFADAYFIAAGTWDIRYKGEAAPVSSLKPTRQQRPCSRP